MKASNPPAVIQPAYQQLLARYQSETMRQQLMKRRQFHNFVADRLQQQKITKQMEDQISHLDYLDRLDRLRREREQLSRDKPFNRLELSLNEHPHKNFDSDHSVMPPFEGESKKRAIQLNPKTSSFWDQSIDGQGCCKIENEKKFTPNYYLKGKMADQITKRWVPYHLQHLDPREQQNKKEEEENQRWFKAIQDKMAEVKNKIASRQARPKLPDQGSGYGRKNHPEKKHVSFIETRENDQKHIDSQKDKLYRSYVDNQNRDKKEKKASHKGDKSKRKRGFMSECVSPKMRKKIDECALDAEGAIKLGSAFQRIKNRLDLSEIVFQDSNHRTINHEKVHLSKKYENECRIRKDMISKICGAKTVSQKYNIIAV